METNLSICPFKFQRREKMERRQVVVEGELKLCKCLSSLINKTIEMLNIKIL